MSSTASAGEPGKDKKAVWIIARQHPGESMAEWFMEGFLDELTDPHNAFSNRALKEAVFYVVCFSCTCLDPPPPHHTPPSLSPEVEFMKYLSGPHKLRVINFSSRLCLT